MQCCISCSIQIDVSVTNHAQIFERVCVGELRAIMKESGHILGARNEAHHLQLMCIDRERLPKGVLCAYTPSRSLFSMVCIRLA